MLKKTLLIASSMVLIFSILAFIFLFVWPRPEDTTNPAIFEGDGASVNYCNLPNLHGNGLLAEDIPKAYTPGCGFEKLPLPVLADCSEPLPDGFADIRGLWQGVSGRIGHLERIEQCGNRVVITVANLIHDFRADGSLTNGARDINPPNCMNFASAIHFSESGALIFRPFNLFDAVERRLEGDDLMFTYLDGVETRMKRICSYPAQVNLD